MNLEKSDVYIEYCRGKKAAEILQQLKSSNIHNIPSKSSVYLWWISFKKGTRTSVFDAIPAGQPLSLSSTENLQKIQALVEMHAKLSIPVSYTHLTLPTIYSV